MTGKKTLVIGTGLSGAGAVRLLHELGADITVLDQNTKITADEIRAKLDERDRDRVHIAIGELTQEEKDGVELVVPSPAVPADSPLVSELRKKGAGIWSEIELAYRCAKGRLAAITGTNGKTTTTTLVGEIFKACYDSVFVVGNIGFSYAGVAMQTTEESVTAAEISSFQLELTEEFHPNVSAILNITPDHMNRHYTMDNYIAIKEMIAQKQTKEDTCVLNYEDPALRTFGMEKCSANVVWFSSRARLENGYYLEGEDICFASGGNSKKLMNIHDMHLVGLCNVENVMAAMGIASAMGVPMDIILKVIRDFPPVEHRIEFVATKGGVDYYNDSKGTNPDAAIQGIRAMKKPTILIGGGFDKGSTYDEWIDAFDGKVRELVLIGQTREKIAECARAHGFTNITFADTYEECLKHCTEVAKPGDAVLLSPACASWGMFPNYEVRGEQFKEYVRSL
ncbi:MAG: UDP-N-acetylmuramoyl-L-alanine--D-glutamate ligase [Lachnospiraceae bacterium]|nr:UDP-N-acetylmuramoyl-L-alanine--D-glutamate ligase [Lachnospiraceae bacterium]